MKLKQLEYLMKVVECGSITQAAQLLYISQPSLTKAISNLEEEYNIQILVRKPRGVELTPQGRDFAYYARGVLSAVRALHNSAYGDEIPKTRLFVATQQLDFIYELVVEAYRRGNAQRLYYNLVETDRNDVARQVLSGQVDVGFAVRSKQDTKDFLWNSEARRLEIHVIDTGGCLVAVGPESPLWSREQLTFGELDDQLQVALDMEDQVKQAFWADNSHYGGFNKNQIIFCNTVAASEYFLLNTAAFAYVSPWTKDCYKSPDIRIIPVKGDPQENDLIWIKRAGEPLSRTECLFLQLVYALLGRPLPKDFPEVESVR